MVGEIFGVDGIIVLIVVLVVLFGGAAIPKFARSLGSAKTEFEKGLKESHASETSTVVTETTVKATDEAGPVTPK